MKRALLLLLLILLPALVACGSSKSDDDQSKADADKAEHKKEEAENAFKKKPLPICPQVAIVRELGVLRDYGEEKPDPSQIVAVARMESIEGDCAYPDDGGIDIEFDLHMIAQRGARLGGNHQEFPFFIAVVDPNGDVLNKNEMSTKFKLSDDDDLKKVYDKTENLHVFIPLDKHTRELGPKYQVLVGFQLTQAQLDRVRVREAAEFKGILPPEDSLPPRKEPVGNAVLLNARPADGKDFAPKPKQPEADKPAAASTEAPEAYPVDQSHFLKLPDNYPASPPASASPSNISTDGPVAPSAVVPLTNTPPASAPPADTSPVASPPADVPSAAAPSTDMAPAVAPSTSFTDKPSTVILSGPNGPTPPATPGAPAADAQPESKPAE